ncbi:hypothetical protein [Salinimonas lutimaris]|uniref:hypothetical protein n=1 Tax=Salinimonas lutimaris TaxID=914153 RepID=UPI0010C02E81|nr:hypothetical protein [Salinimonas lutimaris]
MRKRISSSEFVAAIKESLKDLVEKGESINQTLVINNARTRNGQPVGKTTLYRKNDSTGEAIHQDLIDDIEAAKNETKKKKGRKTRGETIDSLKKDKAALEKEKQGLVNKVVEQEAQIIQQQRGEGIHSSLLKSFEAELYVAHSLLLKRYPALKDFKSLVSEFERKHKDTEYLEHLKKRIEALDADIQYSTVYDAKFRNNHR